MERSKYLRTNAFLSATAGFALLIYTAEQQVAVPLMIVIGGMAIYSGLRDFIAYRVMRDEEDERIEGDY